MALSIFVDHRYSYKNNIEQSASKATINTNKTCENNGNSRNWHGSKTSILTNSSATTPSKGEPKPKLSISITPEKVSQDWSKNFDNGQYMSDCGRNRSTSQRSTDEAEDESYNVKTGVVTASESEASDLDSPLANKRSFAEYRQFTSSGDETDAVEESTAIKTTSKHLRSKKQRETFRGNKFESCSRTGAYLMPLNLYPVRVRRSGYISGRKYIMYKTSKIQNATKFGKRFFEYKQFQFDDLRKNAEKLDHFLQPIFVEKLLVDLIHSYCWPIPFPLVKVEDMKGYKELLREKREELEFLLSILEKTKLPNLAFFQIRIKSLLAFTYIGENKLGSAEECLEQASEFVFSLEPCEWTAWFFLGYAFCYITWGAAMGVTGCFKKALPFLQMASDHIQVDVENGASLGIANSLIMWWMFLIKSETVREADMKVVRAGGKAEKKASMESPLVAVFGRKPPRLSEEASRESAFLLSRFEEEAKVVETFPTDLEKANHIIKGFKKCRDAAVSQEEKESSRSFTTTLEEAKHTVKELDEESALDISELHNKLLSDLSKHEVPLYIQSMRKSEKRRTITINVLKSKLEEATSFLQSASPEVFESNKIKFVPQDYDPSYGMETSSETGGITRRQERQEFPKNAFRSELVSDDGCNDPVRNISSLPDGFEYGSFGGLMIDKRSKKPFGTTAKHVITGRMSSELTGRHAWKEKNVYIENDEEEFVEISQQCCGFLGVSSSEHKVSPDGVDLSQKSKDDKVVLPNGVDFAVFPLNDKVPLDSFSHKSKDGKIVPLRIYEGTTDGLMNEKVQKSAATTKETEGFILFVDMEFNVGGKFCQGSFIVSPPANSDPFALQGDSGGWVILCDSDVEVKEVCGMVHKVQKKYKYEPEDDESEGFIVEDVTWCLRIDNAVKKINKEFGFDLEIYKHSRDSGYSSEEAVKMQNSEEAASCVAKEQNGEEAVAKEQKRINKKQAANNVQSESEISESEQSEGCSSDIL